MGCDQILNKKKKKSQVTYIMCFLDTKYSKTYQHVSTWDVDITQHWLFVYSLDHLEINRKNKILFQ